MTRKIHRLLAYAYFNNECNICKGNKNLRIHHIDGDNSNDVIENFVLLCSMCHGDAHSYDRINKIKKKTVTLMNCKKCEHSWTYRGSNLLVTCPSCMTKVKKEDDENE
jgi:hypothetical protein